MFAGWRDKSLGFHCKIPAQAICHSRRSRRAVEKCPSQNRAWIACPLPALLRPPTNLTALQGNYNSALRLNVSDDLAKAMNVGENRLCMEV